MSGSVLPLLLLFSVVSSSYLPTPLLQQGNKRRTAQKLVRTYANHAQECQEHIQQWQEWDGGLQFNVVFHNDGIKSLNKWKVTIELTEPVKSLKTYNGVVEEESDTLYKVNPPAYASELLPGAKAQFQLHVTFDRGSDAPRVRRLIFNDEDPIVCIEVKEEEEEEENESVPQTAPVVAEVEDEAGAQKPEYPAVPGGGDRGVHVKWPKKVLGLYILLADNDEEGFENDSDSWTPELFPWQQESANVLFFTFIHPSTMAIPPSFKKLAATRGTDQPGAVPQDTVIIFAIGGYAYSLKPNPWHWLESREAAEAMAEKVAEWPRQYQCDGIDLDLEEGAGAHKKAGENMIHFIRRLRQLQPDIIISQPTYGYPAVQAESDVINASWDVEGKVQNLADAIGLMVYEGTQALNYVKNFARGSEQWEGFPIKVNVPTDAILLGAKGSSSSATINALARAAVEDDLLGIMVWYASVKNGFHYAISWDASIVDDAIDGYKNAKKILDAHN